MQMQMPAIHIHCRRCQGHVATWCCMELAKPMQDYCFTKTLEFKDMELQQTLSSGFSLSNNSASSSQDTAEKISSCQACRSHCQILASINAGIPQGPSATSEARLSRVTLSSKEKLDLVSSSSQLKILRSVSRHYQTQSTNHKTSVSASRGIRVRVTV